MRMNKSMPDERWEYAGFGVRFLANLWDGATITVVALAADLLVDRLILRRPSTFFNSAGSFGVADSLICAWFLWNLTYLVGATGQSWGRRVVGLKVVSTDGHIIGFWRSLGRNLFALFISGPILDLGFLWIIWDGKKQAWHDKVFRTYVLRRVSLDEKPQADNESREPSVTAWWTMYWKRKLRRKSLDRSGARR
jgi:uncharacterized RDD family membrane protein YckC